MILREATRNDLRPLATFLKRELDALGVRHAIDRTRLRRLKDSHRMFVLLEGTEIVACLIAALAQTERGPGAQVVVFAVKATHPDRIKALDALCLYALNVAASEGRYAIYSDHDTKVAVVYGRDFLGMESQVIGVNPDTGEPAVIHQEGDARAIMERIFERRPAWRTSL